MVVGGWGYEWRGWGTYVIWDEVELVWSVREKGTARAGI
jgi:hypothetical protein